MFPTIDSLQSSLKVRELENAVQQPVQWHFRSLTNYDKIGAVVVIALVLCALLAGWSVSKTPAYDPFRANITYGVCAGVVALTVVYLIARHFHFKKEVDKFLNSVPGARTLWDSSIRYLALNGRYSSVPTLPSLRNAETRATLDSLLVLERGQFVDTEDSNVVALAVKDQEGYHLIFERNTSEHSETFFPNLVCYEKLLMGDLKMRPKNIVVCKFLTEKQMKVIQVIIGIGCLAFAAAVVAYAFTSLKTGHIVAMATSGSVGVLVPAYVAIQYFMFKRKVDAYVGEQMRTNLANIKDPASYSSERDSFQQRDYGFAFARLKVKDGFALSFQRV